jgi:hypothetical protein
MITILDFSEVAEPFFAGSSGKSRVRSTKNSSIVHVSNLGRWKFLGVLTTSPGKNGHRRPSGRFEIASNPATRNPGLAESKV